MRATSALLFVVAFALSVNAKTAATPEVEAEPGLSEYVTNCYNDIVSAALQFHVFAGALGEYKDGDSYDNIHIEEQIIEDHLKNASVSCCISNTDGFSEDESIEGFELISVYGESTDYALVVAQALQPKISAKPFIASPLSDDISALSEKNDALFICLEKNSPPKYANEVKTLGSYVTESYAAAKAVFVPQE